MNGESISNLVPSGVQGICPNGWHVPSDGEWKILEGMVDTQYKVGDSIWEEESWRGFDVAKRLKSVNGWYINSGANDFNFTALPGGDRNHEGIFQFIETHSYFWSSSGQVNWGIVRYLRYDSDKIVRGYSYAGNAFSLRCIKD